MKLPILARFVEFLGHIFRAWRHPLSRPPEDRPWTETRRLSRSIRISPTIRPGRVTERKQDSVKKSQKCFITSILREVPAGQIGYERCMVGDVYNVMTYAQFQIDIFLGYTFTGDRIFYFAINICMVHTTVQYAMLHVIE